MNVEDRLAREDLEAVEVSESVAVELAVLEEVELADCVRVVRRERLGSED